MVGSLTLPTQLGMKKTGKGCLFESNRTQMIIHRLAIVQRAKCFANSDCLGMHSPIGSLVRRNGKEILEPSTSNPLIPESGLISAGVSGNENNAWFNNHHVTLHSGKWLMFFSFRNGMHPTFFQEDFSFPEFDPHLPAQHHEDLICIGEAVSK